ncbi:MAG: hypothetical protein WCA79_07110 [Anaerolineales bacterium]
MPAVKTRLAFEPCFTEFEKITRGIVPHQMEDKWFIFLEDMQLNFHRSWTGQCIYQIKFKKKE